MFALLAVFGDLGCAFGPWLAGVISDVAEKTSFVEMDSLKLGVLFATIFPLVMLIFLAVLRRSRSQGLRKSPAEKE